MSKILFTPTVNSANKDVPFGGVIWRCNEVTSNDQERKVPCMKFTKLFSRMIFYYHCAIFHRQIDLKLRWVVIEFTTETLRKLSSQTHLLCHSSWLYLYQFFNEFTQEDRERSEFLRRLLSDLVRIVKCVYQTGTLFLVRLSSRSDRQVAMNLLIQTATFIFAHMDKISNFDAGILDSMLEEISPKQLGNVFPMVTGRAFYHVFPGQTTYFYHTFQYCPHLVEDGCPECRISHTQHMAQTRRFLTTTHTETGRN